MANLIDDGAADNDNASIRITLTIIEQYLQYIFHNSKMVYSGACGVSRPKEWAAPDWSRSRLYRYRIARHDFPRS